MFELEEHLILYGKFRSQNTSENDLTKQKAKIYTTLKKLTK